MGYSMHLQNMTNFFVFKTDEKLNVAHSSPGTLLLLIFLEFSQGKCLRAGTCTNAGTTERIFGKK